MSREAFPYHKDLSNLYLKDILKGEFSEHLSLPLSECYLLDIGCGTGRLGMLLGREVKQYCGIDIDAEAVSIARKIALPHSRVIYEIADAEDIPFGENFDIMSRLLKQKTTHFSARMNAILSIQKSKQTADFSPQNKEGLFDNLL